MQRLAPFGRWRRIPAQAFRLPLLGLLAIGIADTFAVDTVRLEIGDLQAAFGSAEGVVLLLEPARGDLPAVSITARAVVLPEPIGRLAGLRIDCAALITGDGGIACRDARVSLTGLPFMGPQDMRADLAWQADPERLELRLRDVQFAKARLEVDLQGTTDEWTVAVHGRGLDAAALGLLAGELGLAEDLPELEGRLDAGLIARGGDGVEHVDARIEVHSLSGSDPSGRLAVEALGLSLELELLARDDGWAFELETRSASGQLYVEPWFLEPGTGRLELAARGVYSGSALELNDWSLRQQDVLAASGTARIALKPEVAMEEARVSHIEAQFPEAYRTYLQPYLYGGPLDALETAGRVEGEISLTEQGLRSISLTVQDLHVDDTENRFAVYDLNGTLRWSDGREASLSRLSWGGGFVYGIGFGPARLEADAGEGFHLLEPLVLPVLDGTLRVRELAVSHIGTPALEILFDAELEPLDMRALTAALDWPSFSGRLSGRIPDLSYADGVVTLGGDLTAEVFDGEVTVENLQLREPFGTLPRLEADASLRGLDLAAVTETFEIGLIEGGLDGDVRDLRLLRWRPVAFDAHFYTPPEDDLRHRISQRAVESISRLGGGGAGAALSSGFLQFFETFAYARLGLGCRLENAVCHMRGVGPAPEGGYYIVEGKWLPRINVIGHARDVDWPVLLEQLESLANAGEVVVQ